MNGADARQRWVVLSVGAYPTEDIYFFDPFSSSLPGREVLRTQLFPSFLRRKELCPPRQQARRRATARSGGVPSLMRLNTRRWYGSPAWALRRLRGANIVICRSLSLPWIALLEAHRHEVAGIYYVIDDDLGAAAGDSTLPDSYRQRLARITQQQQPRLLALADEVVTSSRALADRFVIRHERVSVLTPPLVAGLPDLTHFDNVRWRVGFHGTRAHLADLTQVAPAIRRLHERTSPDAGRPCEFEIMLGRHTPAELQRLARVTTPRPLPWWRFRQYQKTRRMHIGLAPLLDTAFNRGKSFIKFLDISAMGGVGIYSRRLPYTAVVSHGVDGLLADNDPNDWYDCLCQLLDNPERTEQMARNAAAKACEIGDVNRVRRFWLARCEHV